MRTMMLAISSRSPNAQQLILTSSVLAAQVQAHLFVVHVREPWTLHYRMPASENPVPEVNLAYAKKLGASVIIEHGDVCGALISFARKMSIDFFVTGRSRRSWVSFAWSPPLAERIQRKVPRTIVLIV